MDVASAVTGAASFTKRAPVASTSIFDDVAAPSMPVSHSFLKPASAFVSVRVGMMTFGMTHGSSYSAAPMAEAMVMPSPVFMALPRYWKPISLMAGTSWSQYSALPPKPPVASTTAFARSSWVSPSMISSFASVDSIVRTPKRSNSAANAFATWTPASVAGSALTSGFTVSVPTISLVNDFSNVMPSCSTHAMVAQLSSIMRCMRL